MEVVVGKHLVKQGGVGRMSGDAGALPECEVRIMITPGHSHFRVRSSG